MATKQSIRQLRAIKGWTQKEAARLIQVHPVTYCEYEAGKMVPSGIILQRMALVFGCSADCIDLDPKDEAVA